MLEKKVLLFQNSMRATVELYEDRKESYPSVKTLVTLGKEDLSIKVTALFPYINWRSSGPSEMVNIAP